MGDILSHLPGVISLYFGISLILVTVIWEARDGMQREIYNYMFVLKLPGFLEIPLIYIFSVSPGSRDHIL